uniref:Uncharacterized protein n=1 Tax=Arundo donax TaxID=35708 RepID=A0A0A9H7Y2_ARUDO
MVRTAAEIQRTPAAVPAKIRRRHRHCCCCAQEPSSCLWRSPARRWRRCRRACWSSRCCHSPGRVAPGRRARRRAWPR